MVSDDRGLSFILFLVPLSMEVTFLCCMNASSAEFAAYCGKYVYCFSSRVERYCIIVPFE